MQWSRILAKPLIIRRINGHSMDPTLHEGQTIVASSLLNPRVGSIIVVRKDNKEIIKRVREVTEDKLVLIGDNAHPAHNMTVSRSSFVARQLL